MVSKISDAWLVVEEMERKGLRYHLSRMQDKGVLYWENDLEDEARSGRYFNGRGDTVPEAICKASLKACGVEVEG